MIGRSEEDRMSTTTMAPTTGASPPGPGAAPAWHTLAVEEALLE
jgi:hypothetical protein